MVVKVIHGQSFAADHEINSLLKLVLVCFGLGGLYFVLQFVGQAFEKTWFVVEGCACGVERSAEAVPGSKPDCVDHGSGFGAHNQEADQMLKRSGDF